VHLQLLVTCPIAVGSLSTAKAFFQECVGGEKQHKDSRKQKSKTDVFLLIILPHHHRRRRIFNRERPNKKDRASHRESLRTPGGCDTYQTPLKRWDGMMHIPLSLSQSQSPSEWMQE